MKDSKPVALVREASAGLGWTIAQRLVRDGWIVGLLAGRLERLNAPGEETRCEEHSAAECGEMQICKPDTVSARTACPRGHFGGVQVRRVSRRSQVVAGLAMLAHHTYSCAVSCRSVPSCLQQRFSLLSPFLRIRRVRIHVRANVYRRMAVRSSRLGMVCACGTNSRAAPMRR